jgi:hypothetical protein
MKPPPTRTTATRSPPTSSATLSGCITCSASACGRLSCVRLSGALSSRMRPSGADAGNSARASPPTFAAAGLGRGTSCTWTSYSSTSRVCSIIFGAPWTKTVFCSSLSCRVGECQSRQALLQAAASSNFRSAETSPAATRYLLTLPLPDSLIAICQIELLSPNAANSDVTCCWASDRR